MEHRENRAAPRIRQMFDSIAPRYDLLNHLLSANQDRRWRRAAVAQLDPDADGIVLDLCGGTGDLTLEVARSGRAGSVVCCDFAHKMLTRAGPKFRRRGVADRCSTVQGDALRLPFADGAFQAVTVAFGVRNFADMDAGLREIHRVVADGGRLIVLEFSRPTAPVLGPLYRFYLKRILPRIGSGLSGRAGPYAYLARTITGFPDPATLAGRIREAGFAACGWQLRTGGVVALHTAYR